MIEMKIEIFTNDDFAKAASLAAGAWGGFYTDERQWFIDAVAEYILRYNYSNPLLALKAVGDDGVIHGVLFANLHDDKADVIQWRENIEAQMTDHERGRFCLLADYMLKVDGKTVQCMSDGDVKLSLFISNQKGCGKLLLQAMMEEFQCRSLRHLYLWTDTSCTHEYYPQHGFTLAGQFLSEVYDSYAPGYTTYIYKKDISSESK